MVRLLTLGSTVFYDLHGSGYGLTVIVENVLCLQQEAQCACWSMISPNGHALGRHHHLSDRGSLDLRQTAQVDSARNRQYQVEQSAPAFGRYV